MAMKKVTGGTMVFFKPIFDIADRGYRVRAFYVPETLIDPDLAHVCITNNGELVQLRCYAAYRIWNIAAHFRDIVDGEIEGNARGYEMAAWKRAR